MPPFTVNRDRTQRMKEKYTHTHAGDRATKVSFCVPVLLQSLACLEDARVVSVSRGGSPRARALSHGAVELPAGEETLSRCH